MVSVLSAETTNTDARKTNSKRSSRKGDDKSNEREGFGNNVEFILTCLGLSVGLGNIWRFPTRAYENGGSAFLIPYLACAFLFGLPAIYIEFLAGQYQRTSPPIVFRRIMPILEGVGWMSSVVSACVAVYYIVIISWICLYLVNLFRGDMSKWTKCDNPWNNVSTCIDMVGQKVCNGPSPPGQNTNLPKKLYYINGTCVEAKGLEHLTLISGTEQYFKNNIINPSRSMDEITQVHWQNLLAMVFCWILTGLIILKGMKIMGKTSYITVILPYAIVLVLCVRGVTLDGAIDGLYYYFGKPDITKVWAVKTWTEALKQLCFSLSVGHGGLMSMASYSAKRNNCFRDALIIIIGDTMMSVIGGAAVFSTLGFLAHQRGVTVPEVVESGLSLAFVVYPEAMIEMPIPWLWTFLFFIMLLLLGMSSEIAYVEVFCSCLYDQFPKLRNKKWMVVSIWCTFLFCVGLIFSTDAGFYWFQMFDEYAAGFSSVCNVTIEVIVISWVYGTDNFKADISEIFGNFRNRCTHCVGPTTPYFLLNWRFISPLIGVILVGLSFIREYPFDGRADIYPPMFDVLGWSISVLPLLMIPLFATRNILWFRKHNLDLEGAVMLQKQHVSYERIIEDYSDEQREVLEILPDFEPWTWSEEKQIDLSRSPADDKTQSQDKNSNEGTEKESSGYNML